MDRLTNPPAKPAIARQDHVPSAQCTPPVVFRLPFDILYKIFMLIHAEDPEIFPFVASNVCQQWRAAALSCPLLWTKVAFERRLPCWEKQEEFLRRSASAGLEISLSAAPFKTSSIKTLKRIMKIILPHTSRWKSLAIFKIPPKIFRILIDAIRHTTFQMLQTLVISGTGIQGRWRDPSLSWSMPTLRNLTLNRSPFIHSSPIFNNLHSLILNSAYTDVITAQHLQGILVRSPALHILKAMNHPSSQLDNPNTHTHPPMLHSNLRYLKIGHGMAEGLFSLVHMPSLETWEANSRSVLGTSASLRMVTALSMWSSPCKLRSFEVNGSEHPEEISSLRGALRVLPLLRTLRFNHVDFGNQWWPTDISTLCPQLATLPFDGCAGFTGMDLLSTVQHQSESGARGTSITVVEIHAPLRNIDESVEEALRAIVELRLQEKTSMCWICHDSGPAW